ncbi:MAG: hypothetical protein EoVTN8_1267 [Fluviibacter phosphoraccumulans EoVTN8]
MPLLSDMPGLPKIHLSLWVLTLSLIPCTVQAQIQAGRLNDGSLMISDQPLPPGVQPLELDQLMTLPPPETRMKKHEQRELAPESKPLRQKQTPEKAATCRGINKRYIETKTTLEQTEKDKASGKLLIPDSGLVAMQQNLATLERLQSLCLK